MQDIQDDKGI